MGKVQEHNRQIMDNAQYRAEQMRIWPSPLEEKMQELLDSHAIYYEFQKIFYIRASNGYIVRYYIADFYIPDRAVIIEVDGKFHDKHRLYDKMRTFHIQEQYPNVRVLRYTWKDLSDGSAMETLLKWVDNA